MKIVASAIVICAMLLTPVHGQQLQSKTEDDVATILATIIAAERFRCIAKGAGERGRSHPTTSRGRGSARGPRRLSPQEFFSQRIAVGRN